MTTQYAREQVTYSELVQFEILICYKCAIPFSVPSKFIENRKDDQREFYCPNGHGQIFMKSTAQLLREQHAKEKQALESQIAKDKREREEVGQYYEGRIREEIKEKKKAKRELKRVHNGTCPCCNRSFVNLLNHMRQKHPNVAPPKHVIPALHSKITEKVS